MLPISVVSYSPSTPATGLPTRRARQTIPTTIATASSSAASATRTAATARFERPSSFKQYSKLDNGDCLEDWAEQEGSAECNKKETPYPSRRQVLQGALLTCSTMSLSPSSSVAGVAELDKSTGSLYSPKREMLSGGSAAARGVDIVETRPAAGGTLLKPGQTLQTVYETRFIAYLSRFLINFDPAANAWWAQNALGGGGDEPINGSADGAPTIDRAVLDNTFAEFANSVEIGLADYFVGPYGSYSSLSAMKAGIGAQVPAKSKRPDDDQAGNGFGQGLVRHLISAYLPMMDKERGKAKNNADRDSIAKQGVLNLYTLLKARYNTKTAKRQLAILFSFFSNPNIQPTAEIRSLLGEVDNATITEIRLVKPYVSSESNSRTSSRRGGGYSYSNPPTIEVDPPPALGAEYKCCKVWPVMKPSSRILRIKVIDGGQGYTKAPEVYISSGNGRQCSACAVIDREGHVESVIVLDPGYGYGRRSMPPKVTIAPPDYRGIVASGQSRQAQAKAELEYEIVSVQLYQNGSGYVATEPASIRITPPEEDPDWFVDAPELAAMENEFKAEVTEMRGPKGNVVYRPDAIRAPVVLSLERVRADPTELLPSAVRPELNSLGTYIIPSIAAIRTYDDIMDNPRFRAVDPLFGAIGTIPAQKSASELKPSEYARLALSGAVCTVLVRTALNPLELVKTKLQLENDVDLLNYARQSRRKAPSPVTSSKPPLRDESWYDPIIEQESPEEASVAVATKPKVSTTEHTTPAIARPDKIASQDLILGLVELRGPAALFQSADITFLASLAFGSLGFGATELFRRSFTMAFFMGEEGGQLKTEVVLLLAATLATILTSAVAAPLELLRVRSMGLVESKPWTDVLADFLEEKSTMGSAKNTRKTIDLKDLEPKDLLPLWAGFGPTASRELAFAIPKFLAFDLIARAITGLINSQLGSGALPIQVGVGTAGLAISAVSGALAGLSGALVSHPADLILTRLSAQSTGGNATNGDHSLLQSTPDWRVIVKELLGKEGGVANLFVGLGPRMVFFFLVIGLQFFLYDYVKNLLNVGSEDLKLVLDVFYAVRQGLEDAG
jgi:hypothetical protein